MVGFKAKARASDYFTKLGWRCGCIFVNVVCVLGGGYICAYGWGVLEGWECIGKEGEKRNYTIISYLLH